jgi:cardiolipin synthase
MLGSLKLKKSDVDRMTEAGVHFAKFNPPIVFNLSLPFKLLRVNHRTHRKLLIVDGRTGFIGGVCFADGWLGNAEPGRWRDTHFRVEGPVVAQMQAVFAENWLQVRSEVLHGRDYFPGLNPAGSMTAQCFASGPKDRAEQARLAYLLSMAAARKNIRLAHAYFVPGELAIETLLDARRRGVKVEVLVPAKIDLFVVRNASRSRWGKLLAAGVEFYEYQPTLYHCKILIVDDIWASVGSVNFDEKSFRHNDESNLNVLSGEFAARLVKTFEEDKSKSRRLTRDDYRKRSWFTKFFDRLFGAFHSDL